MILFWALCALAFIGFIVCAEFGTPEGTLVVGLLAALSVYWFYGFNVVAWIMANPATLAIWVVSYLVVGVLWSGFKYDRVAAAKARYLQKYYPETFKNEKLLAEAMPKVLDNKRNISAWVMVWWASFFWYVVHDLVMDFVNIIIENFGFIYDRIAARHFQLKE